MRRALALVIALAVSCSAATAPTPTEGWKGAQPPAISRSWQNEIVYMVMTDRFRNGDPSNDGDATTSRPSWWQGGDLAGVIDSLDHIRSLGATAVWITPVASQMPGGYHGYWARDPTAVDPHLGDMATLQRLVRAAHERGLRVILDVVINHLGPDHPWLSDPAKAAWFHPRCEIQYTDQKSVEDCWLAGLPDLNTENADVRAWIEGWTADLVRESGVDGLRLDTARHVPAAFLAEWSAKLKAEFPRLWILGEVWSDDYRYQRTYLDAGLDAVTDFFTYENVGRALGPSEDLSWLRLPPPVAESYLGDRATARATFIDNHDVPRFVGPSPDADARARLRQALAYLLTAPGVPVLYYGTEVALPGGADPDNRRFMPWDQVASSDLVPFIRALASARGAHTAFTRGDWLKLDAERDEIAYARVTPGDVAVVVMSANGGTIAIDLSGVRIPPGERLRPVLPGPEGTLEGTDLSVTLGARGVQVWVSAP